MRTRRWALAVLGTAVAWGWGVGMACSGTRLLVLAAHDKRIALTIAVTAPGSPR